ncbi:MAG TPA: hypothetical protein VIE43_21180 [Thermoanaerobaculia bacterium]|jgi:hypothetical protein|nr:hypothetical protein [Thermoanaerobaculia bacterium]
MPLTRRDTPDGPVWVRPPFRPEDYTAPPDALRLFERWQRDDVEGSDALLALRDGPFGNYVPVDRPVHDGKTWIVLLEASREFALEVEVRPSGFGTVVPVPPERAYELACARDALRSKPVIRE